MDPNVGGYDRIARLVVGPALVAAGGVSLLADGLLATSVATLAVLAGAVLLGNGLTRRCGVNRMLDIDTTDDTGRDN